MSLPNGTRLGAYEVLALIGAGGMGEVYRARDTKLGRDVALKVLPEAFALDADRLARFKREAQVLASLNHPHIAAIYGLEESGGSQFLVLELVEGPTLAARLTQGSGLKPQGLPVEEALSVARQVAEACQAAHEKGIVHRDLKPANIAFTKDEQVKVLDFGLAKALEPSVAADVTNSPTLSLAATRAGVILGTAAYMSPEQAKGREADKRSDVWAFGVVLYEMLTGKRAFEGEDLGDTLAAVIRGEPDWNALPVDTPPAMRTLLRRCLDKDRRQRVADISTALFVMSDAASLAPAASAAVPAPVVASLPPWRRALPWTLTAGAGAALAGALVLWAPWRASTPSAPLRLEAMIGADTSLVTNLGAAAILSPDGTRLAFVAQDSGAPSRLYVRALDQLQATALTGTDNASSPFFSPDGRWIAFFADGKLKKIAVTGGAAVTLCDAGPGRGGTWADDNTIVFMPTGNLTDAGPLLRVSSAGGRPEPLTKAEGEWLLQRWPQVLPGGRAVLFSGHNSNVSWDDANLVVQALPNGTPKIVQRGGYYGRYLPSGHLVYIHEGTLFAAPFDLDRLELTAQPVPVLERVATVATSAGAQFAVSDNGTLVYVSGESTNAASAPIVWMNRRGQTSPLRPMPARWGDPHFAPNGQQLAMYMDDGKQSDIWIYDWARATSSRFTFDPANDRFPAWTADGRRLAFASARAGGTVDNLYWQRSDGTGEIQRLTESKNNQIPTSWHPSGKFLAFVEVRPQTGNDVMILPLEGSETAGWKPGTPTALVSSPFSEAWATFSPDGRWLAYTSNESGQAEVYVRPFSGPGGKSQVSSDGGRFPIWSRTRNELLFETLPPDYRIMVASYSGTGESFRAGKPTLWADRRYVPRATGWDVALHPDGERVALAAAPEEQAAVKQDKVIIVFNFFDELRRLAPVTGRR